MDGMVGSLEEAEYQKDDNQRGVSGVSGTTVDP